ncbi:MAG: hypothetical protein ABSF26_11385 [Thermoguttaceae bacterium]|jgi:hypothetical protein
MRNRFPLDEVLGRFAAALLVGTLLLAMPCHGAPPSSTNPFIFPAGGQRGTTVEATICGNQLAGSTGVYVSGKGLNARIVGELKAEPKPGVPPASRRPWVSSAERPTETVRVTIAIAPDAELGEHDVRLLTPEGVSMRGRFVVDELPERAAMKLNSRKTDAVGVESLPAVLNGQIYNLAMNQAGPDCGYWKLPLKAGQTVVCECQARALMPYSYWAVPGWLDACMTLYDPDGKRLKFVDDFRFKPDPVLFHNVEKDGEYLLEIRDVLHRSSHDFIYRIRAGALPYVTHVFPLGGRRGGNAKIELHGVNLPAGNMDLPIPADSPPVRWVSVKHNGVTSNAVPLAVDDLPEVMEQEPNDSAAKANRVTVPVVINGRIQKSGDEDYFVFKAEAGQTLLMEVDARRLDSPLDSVLTLFDAAGKELDENDDPPNPIAEPHERNEPIYNLAYTIDPRDALVTHLADSRLVYTFPKSGDYVLRIRDAQEKGGEEYAYRLKIVPALPDFVLRLNTDSARVVQGDSAVLAVTALRKNDFDGAIELSVEGLPPGLTASRAVIPAGQSEAQLTITAPADAVPGLFSPTIVGKAAVGGQTIVRKAVPVKAVVQAFYITEWVPTKGCVVEVKESAFYTLSSDLPPDRVLEVKEGGAAKLVVKALRKADGKLPVKLAAVPRSPLVPPPPDAPPPPKDGIVAQGVTVTAASIPADKDEATITITAVAKAPVGLQETIIISGTSTVGKQTITRTLPAIHVKIIAK